VGALKQTVESQIYKKCQYVTKRDRKKLGVIYGTYNNRNNGYLPVDPMYGGTLLTETARLCVTC